MLLLLCRFNPDYTIPVKDFFRQAQAALAEKVEKKSCFAYNGPYGKNILAKNKEEQWL
jgi:hypothetical protein